jgi:hypothetical protein
MRINDLFKVKINDRIIEVSVAGLERGCGRNSPVVVKFYIDWDEGPSEYKIMQSKIKFVEGEMPYVFEGEFAL